MNRNRFKIVFESMSSNLTELVSFMTAITGTANAGHWKEMTFFAAWIFFPLEPIRTKSLYFFLPSIFRLFRASFESRNGGNFESSRSSSLKKMSDNKCWRMFVNDHYLKLECQHIINNESLSFSKQIVVWKECWPSTTPSLLWQILRFSYKRWFNSCSVDYS